MSEQLEQRIEAELKKYSEFYGGQCFHAGRNGASGAPPQDEFRPIYQRKIMAVVMDEKFRLLERLVKSVEDNMLPMVLAEAFVDAKNELLKYKGHGQDALR